MATSLQDKDSIILKHNLDSFELAPDKQALYVNNWQQNNISYMRNVQKLLGYPKEIFSSEVVHGNIHPEDLDVVSRIIRAVVDHYTTKALVSTDSYLLLTYRIRKYDGSYLKILRQSGAYQSDKEGYLISNWSLITDIEFISNNNMVEWELNGREFDRDSFRQGIYREFQNFFSKREKEVIQHLTLGATSKEIADKLFISLHTVHTHRKNILRKTNCTSKEQLVSFCKKNGVL